MGARGCYASGEGIEGPLPAVPVDPVDGTGSGDAFVAGLLYGKVAGWSFERSARFANAVGALATTPSARRRASAASRRRSPSLD